MLKHLHPTYKRSFKPSESSTENKQNWDVDLKGTYTRKYTTNSEEFRKSPSPKPTTRHSTKHRKKKREFDSENDRLIRARSAVIQSSERPRFTLSKDKDPSADMHKFIQAKPKKPIAEWSGAELCECLSNNLLDENNFLSVQLRESRVTGKDVSDTDKALQTFSKIRFVNDMQKQKVLLLLNEISRETRKANGPNQRVRSPSALSHSAESSMTSSDYVSGSSSSSDHERHHAPSSSRNTPSAKMIKSIFKGTVKKPKSPTPSLDPQQSNALQTLVLHSDIQGTGEFTSTDFQITEATTTTELVQMFLDCSSISDDINLFVINQVTTTAGDQKGHLKIGTTKKLLKGGESPLLSQRHNLKKNQTRRLELTQVKGVMIKIICRIGKHKPRGKQFRVSSQSSVEHVTKLSLRKFRLRNVETSLFALCEISLNGDIVEIPSSRDSLWKSGTSLLICDRPSLKKTNQSSSLMVPGFHRSFSTVSNISFGSRGSSGSDSWSPYSLDKHNRLCDDVIVESLSDQCGIINYGDVTVNNLPHKHQLVVGENGNVLEQVQDRVDLLSVDNSVLQAQLKEKEEASNDIYRKVSEVRSVLENGLKQYHDSLPQQGEQPVGGSFAIESEMKNTERIISHTEDMLSQLFRHQRQLLATKKKQADLNQGSIGDEIVDNSVLADVELQIATHQADLLGSKQKHQILDMKMSLFVAHRKAEKFRHMISGSLYGIVTPKSTANSYQQPPDSQKAINYALHSSEIFVGKSGYGLSMKDERETSLNGSRLKGTILESDHAEGNLKKGDRLLEVNGINVQSVGADFVARILKETNSIRIVVLRVSKTTHNGNNSQSAKQDQNTAPMSQSSDEDDVIMRDESEKSKPAAGAAELSADWREMSALKSDLSMLMRELEITSRSKRELERDLARKNNRDFVLESENHRLKEEIAKLKKSAAQ